MNIYSYCIYQYDNDKIWCFDNNVINFHKKKITAARVEPSQPLVPFSVRLRLLELIYSFYGN